MERGEPMEQKDHKINRDEIKEDANQRIIKKRDRSTKVKKQYGK